MVSKGAERETFFFFLSLYLSTPLLGIEASTSPLEEVRKCHWITRAASKWHFLPPLNMGWRVRPRGCSCNLAIKIIFYPINSYHLRVLWASSFYQKVQVMGLSSGISLSKAKMGLRLSPLPNPGKVGALGTRYDLFFIDSSTLTAHDFTHLQHYKHPVTRNSIGRHNGAKADCQSPLSNPAKVGALCTSYKLFLYIVTTLTAQDFTY